MLTVNRGVDPPEPARPFATANSVYEVLQHPYAWDVDGHDGEWWAGELRERQFFENLNDHDLAVLLAGLTRLPPLSWCKGLQRQLKSAIKDALEE